MLIAGIDEVGRGCLAGPVVTCAIILKEDFFDERIKDSKKLSKKMREKLYPYILENTISYGIGVVCPLIIDKINILNAVKQAMHLSLSRLNSPYDKLIVDAVKEINIKAEEYSENVENSFDTIGMLSWLIAAPLGFGINKLLKFAKADKKVRAIVSTVVPVFTSLGIQMTGTLEEKNASRVGRYKARQDLLKNPARLMAYSDEEMQKVKNVKADKQKQSFWQKLGGSFSFLTTYFKDKSEYEKYKKTTQKENEKLHKAFKEIEISETQKAEAKTLQKNVFRAFDEIDEMSQRYSEDVEAGCDIAKEVGATIWTLGSMLGLGFLAASVIKGKFPLKQRCFILKRRDKKHGARSRNYGGGACGPVSSGLYRR